MVKYWEKFFNLTVLADRVELVDSIVKSLGSKVATSDYKVYDVDGEKIAHYSLIIAEGGKKTYNKIIKMLNSQLS